jgi:hypothetical protein
MASIQTSSSEILVVGVELLGVGLLTLLAGASNEAGKIVVIFMIGLWLIWAITDSGALARIGNVFSNVAAQAR